MTRSTLLLMLASVLPAYVSMFLSPIPALVVAAISTIVGAILTISVMDEFGDEAPIREAIRLGWIVHVAGFMLVYAVHQLS